MQPGVPEFSTVIGPFQSFMENVYVVARERNLRNVTKVSLVSHGWNDTHKKSFEACQRALEHQVTLAHFDLSKRLCVFTDAPIVGRCRHPNAL